MGNRGEFDFWRDSSSFPFREPPSAFFQELEEDTKSHFDVMQNSTCFTFTAIFFNYLDNNSKSQSFSNLYLICRADEIHYANLSSDKHYPRMICERA